MRKLATAAFFFSAAVLLSQYALPRPWLPWCAAACFFFAFFGFIFKDERRIRVFLSLFGLAAGLLWTYTFVTIMTALADELNGKTETVTAVVTGYPEETEYGAKLTVSVKREHSLPVKTQLYIYNNTVPSVEPGNTVSFTARFKLADSIYGEKTETFMSRGIFLFAYPKDDLTIIGTETPFIYLPVCAAHRVSDIVTKIFPDDTRELMRALLLGSTAGVYSDTALSSALTSTGTSHIVSVSGMNVAFLIGFLGLFIKKKRHLAATGIPVILLFMAVVGFSPPVTRAGIMQLFLLTAPLFRRESDAVTSLSASLLFILISNPLAVTSVGLQLSFSATLGIILFTGKIDAFLEAPLKDKAIYKHRWAKGFCRLIIASLAATGGALVLSVPLIALHFSSVSLIAPLSNLLIILPVTIAFCAGIAAVVLGFIFLPIGAAAAFLASLPLRYIIKVIGILANFPFASVSTQNPAISIWLVYVYLILIVLIFLRARYRERLLAPLLPICLSVLSLCVILLSTSLFSDSRRLSFSALDVGQGQSLVVTSGAYTAVIDCGSASGKSAGNILTKHLQSSGRTKIDLLVLTHFHEDHSSGIAEALERNIVSAIAIPLPTAEDGTIPDKLISIAESKGVEVIFIEDNLLVSLSSAALTLYSPVVFASGSEGKNERGVSVLCSEAGFDILVTGDMNSSLEHSLLAAAVLPDLEVLVAGHHGSKYSTSEELLEALNPETAVISVGYNTYGHPAQETLNRMLSNGIAIYRTDELGTITINAA